MLRIWRSVSSIIRESSLGRERFYSPGTLTARTIGGKLTSMPTFVRQNERFSDRDPALRLRQEGIVRDPPALPEQGGVGDHGGVVPGVDEGDEAEVDAATIGPGRQLAPQQAVGGGASRDGEQREGAPLVEPLQAVEH